MRKPWEPVIFWDVLRRDNTDLAVIVAGDICEERINPLDYLPYADNYSRLTMIRYCLLLGSKAEDLAGKSDEELYNIREQGPTVMKT